MVINLFEDLKKKAKTKSGLFDILIGTALKGFLIVTYTAVVFTIINSFLSFLRFKPLILYASFLVFGFFLIPLNSGISFITENTFRLFNKLKKQLFGGR